MGQNQLLISLGLIMIFGIAMVSFAYNFGVENSAAVRALNDTDQFGNTLSTYKTNVETQTTIFSTTANSTQESFSKTPTTGETDVGVLVGIGNFISSLTAPITGLWAMFTLTSKTIFGGDSQFQVIFNVIGGIVVIIAILFVWKTLKGGNPE